MKEEERPETRWRERDMTELEFRAVPKSWGDLLALMSIILMAIGGIAWGLKLEDKIQYLERQFMDVKSKTDKGILPITEERMTVLGQKLSDLQRAIEMNGSCARHGP